VIDSQINVNVASQIGAMFLDVGIPFIAVDIPHPGCFYFGADNYKAGRIAGRHLAGGAQKLQGEWRRSSTWSRCRGTAFE